MALAVLGILLSLLFAAAALRYLTIRPLDRSDRIGARVFFIVIGLPVFFVGLDLISQNTTALMHAFGY
jgi:ABC-type dipeptide/oligopeptide/nickel transport system permease component